MKFIELEAVNKRLNDQLLIDNVNLKIDQGEIVTFEGINGSGKTIILKAILGLIKIDGKISIDQQIINPKIKYPISVGILIERPSLFENMTAFQNLKLLARLQDNVNNNDITQLLTLLGLKENIHQKVKKFSLGMKQKVGIAQALLGRNQLIVLDEPTNALDKESIESLVKIIKDFNTDKTTFLVTSHDAQFLQKISTKHFRIENGGIHEKIS